MKEIAQRLTDCYGPSGHEDRVRDLIQQEIADLVDEVRVDALGNLIGTLLGDGSGRPVMLAAHMDEIGVIVTHIDEKGFLRFGRVGGVNPALCVGNRVRFANGVCGAIGQEKREKMSQSPSFDQLYIDVGARDRESCPVQVGDMACFDRTFVAQGDHWIAKAMDDRIGCVVLIGLIRAIKDSGERPSHTVHFVFSVQEEVGLRGATTAAYGLEPYVGISVDVTLTGDTPKPYLPMAVNLGEGPAIKVKDGGMISHPGLVQLMIDRAEAGEIPYQLEVLAGGTTDARAMQISRAGVIAGCVSVPTRYVHTVSETVDAKDVRNAVRLLQAVLSGPLDF